MERAVPPAVLGDQLWWEECDQELMEMGGRWRPALFAGDGVLVVPVVSGEEGEEERREGGQQRWEAGSKVEAWEKSDGWFSTLFFLTRKAAGSCGCGLCDGGCGEMWGVRE
jgi:hypothetical protein